MDHAAPPTVAGLRDARDDDAEALTALVASCFAEYPGCVLDPDGLDADLRAPATHFTTRGGRLWVVERDGEVVACGGWTPADPATDGAEAEVKRIYVAASARRGGIAATLVRRAESAAAAAGAVDVVAWSDTRFHAAHAMYDRLGYVRTPRTRRLHDPSDTTEYEFHRPLP